jgi:hypothetical protein
VASSEMAPEASPAPEHTATATPLEELRPVLRPVIALAGRGRSE